MKKGSVFLLGTLVASCWISTSLLADINVGIFPRKSVAITKTAFQPLVTELEKSLGEKVNLLVYSDYPAFWEDTKASKFDIVHYTPYHYLKSQTFGYKAILGNVEFGQDKIAGGIVVRKDSGIKTVNDLKGKDIIFGGGKDAMVAYIACKYILKKAGLKDTDYTETISKTPPAAVIPVFGKAKHAAGVGDMSLQLNMIKEKVDVEQLTYLAISPKFEPFPWAVHKRLSEDKVKKIIDFFIALKGKNDDILKSAEVDRFIKVEDPSYPLSKDIIFEALGEKY